MGKNARNAVRPRGGITEEIKRDRQKARLERKTNNNDDLM
jgi:hypothetical protein